MAKQIENPEKVKGNKMTESSSASDDTPGSRSKGKDGKPLQGWELREKIVAFFPEHPVAVAQTMTTTRRF